MQPELELLLNVGLRQGLVAMGGKQALAGGEDGAVAVALYGAAFEYEVVHVTVEAASEQLWLLEECGIDGVVELMLEFLSPSVEAEVEEQWWQVVTVVVFGGGHKGYEGVVACPGVVGGTVHYGGVLQCGDFFGQVAVGGNHYQQVFPGGYLASHLHIGVGNIAEDGCPVGADMWPCELHHALLFPFCGHSVGIHIAKVDKMFEIISLYPQKYGVEG